MLQHHLALVVRAPVLDPILDAEPETMIGESVPQASTQPRLAGSCIVTIDNRKLS